jgi:hypothetical protein
MSGGLDEAVDEEEKCLATNWALEEELLEGLKVGGARVRNDAGARCRRLAGKDVLWNVCRRLRDRLMLTCNVRDMGLQFETMRSVVEIEIEVEANVSALFMPGSLF